MKSKTKNKLVAFVKEAIRAAVAAIMGVAGATLSQEIRDAVAWITPTSLGAEAANGTVKISSVMDLASETYRGSAAQWFAELASVRTMPEADAVMASCQAIDANTLKIECDAGDAPAEGDYPDATLEIGMAHYVEGELVTDREQDRLSPAKREATTIGS